MNKCKLIVPFMLLFAFTTAQTIEGTVTDSDGNALVGANVVVDGTSLGAAADSDRNYMIDAGSVQGQSVSGFWRRRGGPPAPGMALSENFNHHLEVIMVHTRDNSIFNFYFPPVRTPNKESR